MRHFPIDRKSHLPGLRRRRHFCIHGMVKRPQSDAGVEELQAEPIFGFGKFSLGGHPQQFPHSPGDQRRFTRVGSRIGPNQRRQFRRQLVFIVVVGGGMGGATPAILQIVARPNGGVRLVERQLLGAVGTAEEALFPGQMPYDHRPNFARVCPVSRPQQMPEQGIDEYQVHVIVAVRQIAVGVKAGLIAGQIALFVRGGQLRGNRVGILAAGPVVRVEPGPIMPPEFVEHIGAPPAQEPRAPGDGPMHDGLLRLVP